MRPIKRIAAKSQYRSVGFHIMKAGFSAEPGIALHYRLKTAQKIKGELLSSSPFGIGYLTEVSRLAVDVQAVVLVDFALVLFLDLLNSRCGRILLQDGSVTVSLSNAGEGVVLGDLTLLVVLVDLLDQLGAVVFDGSDFSSALFAASSELLQPCLGFLQ